MTQDIFLGRTQEQEQFRSVLRSLRPTWVERNLPTVLKLSQRQKTSDRHLPFVLLFDGEGGMGKTTLIRRLRRIVETEKGLKGEFNLLFLDWEEQQKRQIDLSVGHDHIYPETVLAVLHKALVDAGWGSYFEPYRRVVNDLKAIEAKVERQLRSQPNQDLPKDVLGLGAKGIGWVIRQSTGLEAPTAVIEPLIRVSAEGLHQVRQFVQKSLSAQEYDTYAQPHERLAEALGKGIAELAKRKPLVILLDTYEIVDRPECDYTMRTVIRCGGGDVVWVIAGRANLADSGQRGNVYFRGYKRDFPEERIYAKGMSEFSLDDIQSYFQQVLPDRSLTQAQAEALSRFSLGIPFVISEAAAMWREGKPIEEIVEPVAIQLGKTTAREQVVKVTSERFLVHCFGAKEREWDLQAIYALVMMRTPNVDLLKAMLDVEDLGHELQMLRERYSFIWVDEVRLDEKLAGFLREYLLKQVQRTSPMVQQVNDRAIAWLRLQTEQWSREIEDTADRFEHERLAEAMIDLIYHHFWKDEEVGWRCFLPHFIEGWQYSRSWTRSLLEVVALFNPILRKEGKRRLKLMEENLFNTLAEIDSVQQLLTELEKLSQHRGWNSDQVGERKAILSLQKGQVLYRQEKYKDALKVYLDIEKRIPERCQRLRQALSNGFCEIGYELGWENITTAITSEDGELAFEKAVVLDPDNASAYYGMGVMKSVLQDYEKAIYYLNRAIELDSEDAAAYNSLGNALKAQQKEDEAIKAYLKAIEVYHKALKFAPEYHATHNNLGWLYLLKRDLAQAKAEFEAAIRLNPQSYSQVLNLGLVYALEGDLDTAKLHWQQGLILCQVENAWDKAIHAVYTVALGEPERGMAELQATIQVGALSSALKVALDDAEVLAQLPVKPKGIDHVIELLKQAIDREVG